MELLLRNLAIGESKDVADERQKDVGQCQNDSLPDDEILTYLGVTDNEPLFDDPSRTRDLQCSHDVESSYDFKNSDEFPFPEVHSLKRSGDPVSKKMSKLRHLQKKTILEEKRNIFEYNKLYEKGEKGVLAEEMVMKAADTTTRSDRKAFTATGVFRHDRHSRRFITPNTRKVPNPKDNKTDQNETNKSAVKLRLLDASFPSSAKQAISPDSSDKWVRSASSPFLKARKFKKGAGDAIRNRRVFINNTGESLFVTGQKAGVPKIPLFFETSKMGERHTGTVYGPYIGSPSCYHGGSKFPALLFTCNFSQGDRLVCRSALVKSSM